MSILTTNRPVHICSDGRTFIERSDAEAHEAELDLRLVCEKHGYTGESFSRAFLYNFLLDVNRARDIHAALGEYLRTTGNLSAPEPRPSRSE